MYSGGIGILLGGITVTDGSQIDGNSNNGPGGGIAANFGGAVVITDSSQVDGNTAAGIGGGIVNFSENFGIDIDDSEVANNTVTNVQDTSAGRGTRHARRESRDREGVRRHRPGRSQPETGTSALRERLRSSGLASSTLRSTRFPLAARSRSAPASPARSTARS